MNRDYLDDAIGQIAARLTHVDESSLTVERIVQALPQRTAGLAWHWLLPRFALGALAMLAVAVVLRTFDDGSTTVLRTANASAPIVELARTIPAEAPVTPIVEHPQNRRRTVVELSAKLDHDFSLPAIAAPIALSVGYLTPDDLPAENALAIAPLAIADLPLTAEFSQR